MSSNPDPFPEISCGFTAASDQAQQRKLDVVAEMRRIVQERTGKTFTQEEFAKLVLSSQGDRQHQTPSDAVADMRSTAEDYRCEGSAELAAELNGFATLAEGILNR